MAKQKAKQAEAVVEETKAEVKEIIDPKVMMIMGMMAKQKETEKGKQKGIYNAMPKMVIDRR